MRIHPWSLFCSGSCLSEPKTLSEPMTDVLYLSVSAVGRNNLHIVVYVLRGNVSRVTETAGTRVGPFPSCPSRKPVVGEIKGYAAAGSSNKPLQWDLQRNSLNGNVCWCRCPRLSSGGIPPIPPCAR